MTTAAIDVCENVMPVNLAELIYALWEALENSECLAVWENGYTAPVVCGETSEFEDNPPLLILDPGIILEETASLDHALADEALHGILEDLIIRSGGSVIGL